MPISEDEYNQYSNDSIPSTTMSKAELRKTHKPIMEKRRRAKINNCLNEIKQLILVAMKKDPERHSKLEKADILEMAVKHLKNVQRQQRDFAIRTDPTVAQKYKAGFIECADEVTNYVNQLEGVDPAMKQRLIAHLKKCAGSIEQKPQFGFPNNPFPSGSSLLASFASNRFNSDDQNNNNHNTRIELIPSCLPNGDFAFLVPKSSFSSILSSQLSEDRPSAFVTVTPSSAKPTQSDDFLKISKSTHSENYIQISKPLSPPISPVGFQPIKPKMQAEIQNIRYPINPVKKENISEPLCIITNNSERFRQAQMLQESCNSEENSYRGIKRRFREESQTQGLLTLAVHESPKKVKVEEATSTTSSKSDKDKDAGEGSSKNDSMWRPW